MSQRTLRVADLVRRELSDVLLRDVADPRVRLATISQVIVSNDLQHAKVLVSVLGDDGERDEALSALGRATGYVRGQLARRLRDMRRIPELVFELDRGPEHSQRISELLENLPDEPSS